MIVDFNVYRKNTERIEALVAERASLVAIRSKAILLRDWQFKIDFGSETIHGFEGIAVAVIADLEQRVATVDTELSGFGFTFDGQQNLPLDFTQRSPGAMRPEHADCRCRIQPNLSQAAMDAFDPTPVWRS